MKFIILPLVLSLSSIVFSKNIDWYNIDNCKINELFIKKISKKRLGSEVYHDKGLHKLSDMHSSYLSLYSIPFEKFTSKIEGDYLAHIETESDKTKTFEKRLSFAKFQKGNHAELCSMDNYKKTETYEEFVERVFNGFIDSKLGHEDYLLEKKFKYINVTSKLGLNGFIYTVVVLSYDLTDLEKIENVISSINDKTTNFDNKIKYMLERNISSVNKGWGTKKTKKELLENAIIKHEIMTSNNLKSEITQEMYMVFIFALESNSYSENSIKESFNEISVFYESLK